MFKSVLTMLLAFSILATLGKATAAPAKRAMSARELAIAKKLILVVREKFKKGKIKEARDELQKLAVAAPPEYADNIYFYLGKCYFYLNDHNKAYKVFNGIAAKYQGGDIVRKRTLQTTLLHIIEDMSKLETHIQWERFSKRFDARGKPVWEVNRNFERINFRPPFKYFSILEKLDPLCEETVRAQEHLTTMLNTPLHVKVVDYKSVSREGLHPNNWRTALTPEESKLFSEFISSEMFEDWVTPHLGQVVGLYNNMVGGKDHFEVRGSLVLSKLFIAADYSPSQDRFGVAEAGAGTQKKDLFLDKH